MFITPRRRTAIIGLIFFLGIGLSGAEAGVLSGVPYIHQVYDTPSEFNGVWACNAASALMCVQFYGKLPVNNIWCPAFNGVAGHNSPYGFYVAKQYTYNGVTYSYVSNDASGNPARGAYGYVLRNGWGQSLRNGIRDYITNHGLTSSEKSATIANAKAQIDAGHPFVLLTTLTPDGHYVTVIGYENNGQTLVVNDPFGNKAQGYGTYGNYNGAGVKYDWPGYNHGNSSLVSVWCIITAEGSGGTTDGAAYAGEGPPYDGADLAAGSSFTKTWTIRNSGTSTWTTGGDFRWKFDGGDQMSAPAYVTPSSNVAPGATHTFSVNMTVPSTPGTYQGYWQMQHNGVDFGDRCWVLIDAVGGGTDNSAFVSEGPPYDDTHFQPGATFTKTWTLRNSGDTTWSDGGGYRWAFQSGSQMGAASEYSPGSNVSPGNNKTWSVAMTAPSTPGTYTGYWKMEHNGTPFGQECWLRIIVDQPATTDGAAYVSEGAPYDNDDLPAGSSFTKTWTIRNSGTSTWTTGGSFRWKFDGGDQMGAPAYITPASNVAPGSSYTFSVNMTVPATPGTYQGYWQMQHNGVDFGDRCWVMIDAVSAGVDGASYASEGPPYDNDDLAVGSSFTKTWTILNSGTTTWTTGGDFRWKFDGGDQMSAPAYVTPSSNVAPGATHTFSVNMTVPSTPGTYQGYWQMQHNGVDFGDRCWVLIDAVGGGTDNSAFVSEGPPYDDTHFQPGATFTKTWTLANSGDTTWSDGGGYRWAFQSGSQMGASSEYSPGSNVSPGSNKSWSVPMTAPSTPGTYTGYWKMEHNGVSFGQQCWTRIIVDQPATVDGADYVSEGPPYDGTDLAAGSGFTKTWTIRNSGTSTWTTGGDFRWKFDGGDQMSAPAYVTPSSNVAPGATHTFSVNMTVPSTPGTYQGYWQMQHNGVDFGDRCWVLIDAVSSAPTPIPGPTPGEFDPENIISDADFININSMTLAEIQTFLDGKPGKLKDQNLWQTNPFSYTGYPLYSYVLNNGKLGRESSPAEIIYYSARDSQAPANLVNPQVLIVTLQKEQSLIAQNYSGQTLQDRLDVACGFGCPDAGGCDPKYVGFFNQVISAAYQMTREFEVLSPGVQPSIQIDGEWITPQNRATAVLYKYTPHFHGNQMFYDLWVSYFGSSTPPGTVDDADFLSEGAPYDGAVVSGGSAFSKTWTIKNIGTSTWTAGEGYRWRFDGGDRMSGPDYVAPAVAVAPGESYTFSANLTAPAVPGSYRGYWRMEKSGTIFGDRCWVDIVAAVASAPADRFDFPVGDGDGGEGFHIHRGEDFMDPLYYHSYNGTHKWHPGEDWIADWDGSAIEDDTALATLSTLYHSYFFYSGETSGEWALSGEDLEDFYRLECYRQGTEAGDIIDTATDLYPRDESNYGYGTAVRSIAAGLVVEAYDYGGSWGKIVLIEHNAPSGETFAVSGTEKVWSQYAHLAVTNVAVGDEVARGETIGTMGDADGYYNTNTGATRMKEGTHLHFEIRRAFFPASAYDVLDRATVLANYVEPKDFICRNRPDDGAYDTWSAALAAPLDGSLAVDLFKTGDVDWAETVLPPDARGSVVFRLSEIPAHSDFGFEVYARDSSGILGSLLGVGMDQEDGSVYFSTDDLSGLTGFFTRIINSYGGGSALFETVYAAAATPTPPPTITPPPPPTVPPTPVKTPPATVPPTPPRTPATPPPTVPPTPVKTPPPTVPPTPPHTPATPPPTVPPTPVKTPPATVPPTPPTPDPAATPTPSPTMISVPTPVATATVTGCFDVAGRVTDLRSGQPLDGVCVQGFYPDGRTAPAITDAAGVYRITVGTHFTRGALMIRARICGHLPGCRQEFFTGWGGLTGMDLGLQPDSLPGSVIDGDYNGDGLSEIAIFRSGTGMWRMRGLSRIYFGGPGDDLVAADYDGDGTSEPAVFRGSSGLWYVRGLTRVYFGTTGDIPVPGDYAGEGTARIAIYRGETGLWSVRGLTRFYFGGRQDRPIPGDYAGTGLIRPAVFRASSGLWAVKGLTRAYFGAADDLIVSGDYSGAGRRAIGIFRPAAGLWAVRGVTRFYFGKPGDIPAPLGYDGWIDRPAVFRPSTSLWVIRALTRIYFGSPADRPATR